jgi:hypothetical protein
MLEALLGLLIELLINWWAAATDLPWWAYALIFAGASVAVVTLVVFLNR